jgi:isoprenylcysteine carboxyl methyltransferase (ICMT) family protein YpbQ
LLLLATLQRLIELVIATRNTRALLAEGAYEVGRGHYLAIVFLHTVWLAVLWRSCWPAWSSSSRGRRSLILRCRACAFDPGQPRLLIPRASSC